MIWKCCEVLLCLILLLHASRASRHRKTIQSFYNESERQMGDPFFKSQALVRHFRREAFIRSNQRQHRHRNSNPLTVLSEEENGWESEDEGNGVHFASASSSYPSVSASSSLTSSCPSVCTCKWQKGKKTVSCVSSFLKTIPEGIEPDTQVVHLNDNDFADRLTNSIFESYGLTSLQRIYLSRCKITSVGETFLASLTNLVELDLSHNLLHSIPSESLKSSPFLRRLILSSNRFPVIQDHSFPDLESLQFLDLNHCQIERLEDGAFAGLKALKSLHLSGNQLTVISGPTIAPLVDLQELNLHANSWTCDCSLRDLREHMISRKIPLSYTPTCATPDRLQGRQWSSLALDEFACRPSPSPQMASSSHVSVTEGDDASLESLAESVPKPNFTWFRNGEVVMNGTLMSFGRQIYMIHERNLNQREKSSKLIIYNSMAKDGGLYQCNVSNKAGFIVINLTLEIYLKSRNELQEMRHLDLLNEYSGETIAGIVFGILIIILLVFLFVIFVIFRFRESMIPSSLQTSACFSKCLLNSSHHQRRDHHQDQQEAGSRHNNKIRIIENPASVRNTTTSSTQDERRENGLSSMSNNSKYGSFDVISMMTTNNHKSISEQQRYQQQDTDSGHEEGSSYESRVSVVTSGRSHPSRSVNRLSSGDGGIVREDTNDCGTRMTTRMSNDGEAIGSLADSGMAHQQEEEEESLERPKVRALQVQGTQVESSRYPNSASCDIRSIRDGGEGGEGDRLKRGTVANHYVNQHQQQQERHQFHSTDRLLQSSPSSPSIYTGHHQYHLQQHEEDLLQLQLQQQLHRQRFIPSSNPRPRGSIVTATTALSSKPPKYVLRTLSSTPPEFFDHQRSYEIEREPSAVLNTGSLQRNRLLNSGEDRKRRSSASSSLISSLISSFTNSHHHLRERHDQHLNQSCSRDFSADPSLSLEMGERRAAAGGNRVVTFDLPPASSCSQASKPSLLCVDRHHLTNPSIRRYSLTGGGSPLLSTSSSTSCLISDSSLPAASMESNLLNRAAAGPVIGSFPSRHQIALDPGLRTTTNYATLRCNGRQGVVRASNSPFHDRDAHQNRNLYQVDALDGRGRGFFADDRVLRNLDGSNGKIHADHFCAQRPGSFVDDKMQMMHRILSANAEIANSTTLPANPLMTSSSSSPRCNVLPSGLPSSSIYGSSSSKAPESSLKSYDSNGLEMHAAAVSTARREQHREQQHGQQQQHAFTSPPATSSSSSGVVLDSTHNSLNGSHQRNQLQQLQSRIKCSPDEGLGDERSEFEVPAGGGGGTSGDAIIV